MKLFPVGIEYHYVEFTADYVSHELFDCIVVKYFSKYKIYVSSSIDRRFFKSMLISSISLLLFDLDCRTTVTVRN